MVQKAELALNLYKAGLFKAYIWYTNFLPEYLQAQITRDIQAWKLQGGQPQFEYPGINRELAPETEVE